MLVVYCNLLSSRFYDFFFLNIIRIVFLDLNSRKSIATVSLSAHLLDQKNWTIVFNSRWWREKTKPYRYHAYIHAIQFGEQIKKKTARENEEVNRRLHLIQL